MTTTKKKAAPVRPAAAPAKKTGRKAISLHLGLNGVSAAAYAGWDGPLAPASSTPATGRRSHGRTVARSQGTKATVLLTRKATRAALLSAMRQTAAQLRNGGFFFLSYSGHGGQAPDSNGEEADGQDETWCLHDGQLIDDELYVELSRFAAGVRILVLSDSCHSGTVTRELPAPPAPPDHRPKRMPDAVTRRVYEAHRAFYDGLQKAAAQVARQHAVDPDAALAQVGAAAHATALVGQFTPAVILISGCQDNQTSMDGDHNGAFTEQLLKVWNHGAFKAAMRSCMRACAPACRRRTRPTCSRSQKRPPSSRKSLSPFDGVRS